MPVEDVRSLDLPPHERERLGAVVRTRYRCALATAEARALRIADFGPDGLVFTDESGRVGWTSPSVAAVLGWEPAELEGRNFLDCAQADDVLRLRAALADTWRDATTSVCTGRLVTGSAVNRWCEVSASRVDRSGIHLPTEILLSVRDVHAGSSRLSSSRTTRTPTRSTGLLNRRGLRQILDRLLEADLPVALAFCDLDGFKDINDQHGHSAGGDVLVEVSTSVGTATARTLSDRAVADAGAAMYRSKRAAKLAK